MLCKFPQGEERMKPLLLYTYPFPPHTKAVLGIWYIYINTPGRSQWVVSIPEGVESSVLLKDTKVEGASFMEERFLNLFPDSREKIDQVDVCFTCRIVSNLATDPRCAHISLLGRMRTTTHMLQPILLLKHQPRNPESDESFSTPLPPPLTGFRNGAACMSWSETLFFLCRDAFRCSGFARSGLALQRCLQVRASARVLSLEE